MHETRTGFELWFLAGSSLIIGFGRAPGALEPHGTGNQTLAQGLQGPIGAPVDRQSNLSDKHGRVK